MANSRTVRIPMETYLILQDNSCGVHQSRVINVLLQEYLEGTRIVTDPKVEKLKTTSFSITHEKENMVKLKAKTDGISFDRLVSKLLAAYIDEQNMRCDRRIDNRVDTNKKL